MAFFRWFDFNDPYLSHNLYVSNGITGAPALADHPDVVNTFYMTASGENKVREQFFEEVRAKDFPMLPSRKSALWLFDNKELALRCGDKWGFIKQGRDLIEVEILLCNKMIKVDSKWINQEAREYSRNAQSYWSGEMTEASEPEILFDGALKLLGDTWKSKCKLLPPEMLK
jgi:hypothetical protein